MKTIKLSGKYGVGREAIVDDDDYEKVKDKSWFLSTPNENRKQYVRCRVGKNSDVRMHRMLIGAKKGQMVDHANGNTLDNRKSNLRLCTNRQNQQNQKIHKDKNKIDGKTVPKGVKYDKSRPNRPWVCRIMVNGKRITSKGYKTPELAHNEYVKLSKKYFGEFSNPG